MTDTMHHTTERPSHAGADHHPLIELVKELRDETSLLVRQEVMLARREFQEKIAHVRHSTITILVGGAVALAGVLLLLFAASNGLTAAFIEAGLEPEIAVWLGPLTAGVIAGIAGLITVWGGQRSLRNESVTPHKTIESLEETKEWARQKVATTKEKVTQ